MAWNDTSQVQPLRCLPCIFERKTAEAAATPPLVLPPMRAAVTLAQTQFGPVTPVCYEHLQFQTQSPLAVPAGVMPGRHG